MKLTKKLADKVINFWFGGGCPICSGGKTLTCGEAFLTRFLSVMWNATVVDRNLKRISELYCQNIN
jgi:hypothetical protein